MYQIQTASPAAWIYLISSSNPSQISVQLFQTIQLPFLVWGLDIDYTHRWLVVAGSTGVASISLANISAPTIVSSVMFVNQTGIGKSTRSVGLYKNTLCISTGMDAFRCTNFSLGQIDPRFTLTPVKTNLSPKQYYNGGVRVYEDLIVVMGSGLPYASKTEVYNRTTLQYLSTLCCGAYDQLDVIRAGNYLIMADQNAPISLIDISIASAPQRVLWFYTGSAYPSYQFMDANAYYTSGGWEVSVLNFTFPEGMNYSTFYQQSEFNGYGLAKPFLRVVNTTQRIFINGTYILNSGDVWVTDTYIPTKQNIRFSLLRPLVHTRLSVNGSSAGTFLASDIDFGNVRRDGQNDSEAAVADIDRIDDNNCSAIRRWSIFYFSDGITFVEIGADHRDAARLIGNRRYCICHPAATIVI